MPPVEPAAAERPQPGQRHWLVLGSQFLRHVVQHIPDANGETPNTHDGAATRSCRLETVTETLLTEIETIETARLEAPHDASVGPVETRHEAAPLLQNLALGVGQMRHRAARADTSNVVVLTMGSRNRHTFLTDM
ncbi:unnamed protein product, partial [Protopolystoma xenopodis]